MVLTVDIFYFEAIRLDTIESSDTERQNPKTSNQGALKQFPDSFTITIRNGKNCLLSNYTLIWNVKFIELFLV
jgi:hypothetical protein